MAYAIGGISGCHINPAVTIGVLTAGKMTLRDAIGYIIAQCLGAILGAAVLYLIASGRPGFTMPVWGLGANGWGDGYLGIYNILSAFVIEAVMTFLFIFVILGTTSKLGNSAMAKLAIGVTLMLIHLVTIPVTGTSVNPDSEAWVWEHTCTRSLSTPAPSICSSPKGKLSALPQLIEVIIY